MVCEKGFLQSGQQRGEMPVLLTGYDREMTGTTLARACGVRASLLRWTLRVTRSVRREHALVPQPATERRLLDSDANSIMSLLHPQL